MALAFKKQSYTHPQNIARLNTLARFPEMNCVLCGNDNLQELTFEHLDAKTNFSDADEKQWICCATHNMRKTVTDASKFFSTFDLQNEYAFILERLNIEVSETMRETATVKFVETMLKQSESGFLFSPTESNIRFLLLPHVRVICNAISFDNAKFVLTHSQYRELSKFYNLQNSVISYSS